MWTFLGICLFVIAVNGLIKERREHELKKENPEAWARIKALESHEEIERKKSRNAVIANGTGLALTIAKSMLKK